jgi:hypothetical protein
MEPLLGNVKAVAVEGVQGAGVEGDAGAAEGSVLQLMGGGGVVQGPGGGALESRVEEFFETTEGTVVIV